MQYRLPTDVCVKLTWAFIPDLQMTQPVLMSAITILLPCVILMKTRFRHIMTFTSSHDYPVVEYEHMRHVTHSDINVGVHFGDNHVVSGLAIV